MDTQRNFLNEGTKEHPNTTKTIDNVSPHKVERALMNERQKSLNLLKTETQALIIEKEFL